jgi:glycosyltransferase involved in cell wall biosynthesis
MRVLHVITGLWKHTGGPSEVIPAICMAMADAGTQVTLATLAGDAADSVAEAAERGVRVHAFEPTFRHTVWYSRGLAARLPQLAAAHDVVHIHGIWQFPDWAAAAAARRAGVPYVITPHGSLQPARLRKSRLKKRASAVLADRAMLNQADCLHATAADEAEAFRLFGYRGPIALIPNGITPPTPIDAGRADALAEACRREYPETRGRRILLFLSRIEPIKGVTTLARAWVECAREFPDWHLVIVGPDERGHVQEVQAILRAGGVLDRTTITGTLLGDRKTGMYLASDLFILPTISENFGLVIGESLAHRLPVITTTGAPWRGIVERRCGWWVDPSQSAVTAAMREALATPRETLAAMGGRGAAWINAEFTWEREAKALLETYRWLLGGMQPPPGFISFDAGTREPKGVASRHAGGATVTR